jgi:hypothetical protein
VVDDWRDEPLAEVSVLDSLRKMAQACADQVLQLDRLAAFERRFQEWQQAGRPEERAFDLVGAVVGARAEFSLVRVSASGALIADANARTLYDSLRDFWATTEREKHVDEALSRLERSIRALQDARPARLLRFIALFGFPAFVAPNISKPLVAVGNLAFLRLGVTVSDSARTSAALLSGAEGVLWVIVTLVLYGLLRRVLDRWDPTARPAKDA